MPAFLRITKESVSTGNEEIQNVKAFRLSSVALNMFYSIYNYKTKYTILMKGFSSVKVIGQNLTLQCFDYTGILYTLYIALYKIMTNGIQRLQNYEKFIRFHGKGGKGLDLVRFDMKVVVMSLCELCKVILND